MTFSQIHSNIASQRSSLQSGLSSARTYGTDVSSRLQQAREERRRITKSQIGTGTLRERQQRSRQLGKFERQSESEIGRVKEYTSEAEESLGELEEYEGKIKQYESEGYTVEDAGDDGYRFSKVVTTTRRVAVPRAKTVATPGGSIRDPRKRRKYITSQIAAIAAKASAAMRAKRAKEVRYVYYKSRTIRDPRKRRKYITSQIAAIRAKYTAKAATKYTTKTTTETVHGETPKEPEATTPLRITPSPGFDWMKNVSVGGGAADLGLPSYAQPPGYGTPEWDAEFGKVKDIGQGTSALGTTATPERLEASPKWREKVIQRTEKGSMAKVPQVTEQQYYRRKEVTGILDKIEYGRQVKEFDKQATILTGLSEGRGDIDPFTPGDQPIIGSQKYLVPEYFGKEEEYTPEQIKNLQTEFEAGRHQREVSGTELMTEYGSIAEEYWKSKKEQPDVTVEWMKEHGEFAYEKGGKVHEDVSWEELKEHEPAAEIRKTDGNFEVYLDVSKWYRERRKSMEEQNLFAAKAQQFSLGVLEFADPGFYTSLARGEVFEHIAGVEYGAAKGLREGDILGTWASVQAPAYTNVILPVVGATAFGLAFKYIGAVGATYPGTVAGTVAKIFTKTVPPIAMGTYATVEGTQLGLAFAESQEKGLTQALGYGMRMGAITAALLDMPTPRTHKIQYTSPRGEMTFRQQYLFDAFGKPRGHFGPVYGMATPAGQLPSPGSIVPSGQRVLPFPLIPSQAASLMQVIPPDVVAFQSEFAMAQKTGIGLAKPSELKSIYRPIQPSWKDLHSLAGEPHVETSQVFTKKVPVEYPGKGFFLEYQQTEKVVIPIFEPGTLKVAGHFRSETKGIGRYFQPDMPGEYPASRTGRKVFIGEGEAFDTFAGQQKILGRGKSTVVSEGKIKLITDATITQKISPGRTLESFMPDTDMVKAMKMHFEFAKVKPLFARPLLWLRPGMKPFSMRGLEISFKPSGQFYDFVSFGKVSDRIDLTSQAVGVGRAEEILTLHGKLKGHKAVLSKFDVAGETIIHPTGERAPFTAKGQVLDLTEWFQGGKSVTTTPTSSKVMQIFQGLSMPPTTKSQLSLGQAAASVIASFGMQETAISKVSAIESDPLSVSQDAVMKALTQGTEQTVAVKGKDATAMKLESSSKTIPISKTITKPITETVTKPLTETIMEPITKTITESITKPITKTITEPITKTIIESITKPITKTITESITKPITEPIIGPPFIRSPPTVAGMPFRFGIPELDEPPKRKRITKKKKKKPKHGYRKRVHPVGFYDWLGIGGM